MSTSERPVIVITHGKESYVEEERHRFYDGGENPLIINGRRDWPKALGVDWFRVVTEKVVSIAQYHEPQSVVVKYQLRADLVCAKKPAWVRPDEYQHLPESDAALYEVVRESRPRQPTPLTFQAIDSEAPPRRLPNGISPNPPRHINVRPWFWWTLPCSASPEYVFLALAARVKALDPQQFDVTVYDNIKHLRVTVHEIEVGGVRYAPKTDLVHVDRGCSGIEGDNLDDLLSKVEAWIEQKMQPIRAAMAIADCPACRRPLKRTKTKVVLRAQKPGHRIGHRS